MAEPVQSKIINISKRYDSETRIEIADEVIEKIRRRTGNGIDVNGNLFSAYSPKYEKSGKVDLRLSGNMMSDLELLSHGPGFLRIGFKRGESNDKASWVQRPTGEKLGKQDRRLFVGINQSDLNSILKGFPL